MPVPAVTETVIEQGKALVRAIEAMGTIDSPRLRRRIVWRLVGALFNNHSTRWAGHYRLVRLDAPHSPIRWAPEKAVSVNVV